jgi:hypothetical protein
MEEKYMRYLRCLFLVCIFLFSACIVPINNEIPPSADARLLTFQELTNTQQATITLYTFEQGKTQQYQVKLSVDEAKELTALMMKWVNAQTANPQTADIDHLQIQFLSVLREHLAIPPEMTRFFTKYSQREKVFQASITSSGAGLLVPMFPAPRPRIITLWRADSGKTLATNYATKFGYNATGPHLGIALGFIGVGFSSRIPNQSRYVLVGGALLVLLYGDNITEIVP